jgi:hypothetical protein
MGTSLLRSGLGPKPRFHEQKKIDHFGSTPEFIRFGVYPFRSLSVSELSDFIPKFLRWPALDGYFYSEPPEKYFAAGNFSIPDSGAIILGSNTLDTLFAWPWYNGPYPKNSEDLKILTTKFFGEDSAGKILEIYSSFSESPQLIGIPNHKPGCVRPLPDSFYC